MNVKKKIWNLLKNRGTMNPVKEPAIMNVTGRLLMILSGRKRTDVPAFYGEWFINRLRDGSVLVRNPVNPKQVSKILLSRENIDCIVFWTKNPENFMKYLGELKEYPFYFQFTLNGYGKDIEPGMPDKKKELIPLFQELSRKIGKERVIWRYDPVLISKDYSIEWHIHTFESMAEALEGYTKQAVISFLDIYRKIKGRMEQIQPRTMTGSHFCRYCYANFSPAQVEANRRMHDPESPLLCGRLTGEERITVREMKSAVRPADDGQMRLGFHDAELMRLTGKPGRII